MSKRRSLLPLGLRTALEGPLDSVARLVRDAVKFLESVRLSVPIQGSEGGTVQKCREQLQLSKRGWPLSAARIAVGFD